MSSLWTDLLFMHGHIADPELAHRLAHQPDSNSGQGGKRECPPKPVAPKPKMVPVLALALRASLRI